MKMKWSRKTKTSLQTLVLVCFKNIIETGELNE